MGGRDERARDRRAAVATLAAILFGTMVAFGPGGIHGISYWSTPPIVELRSAEADTTPGVETVGGDAGAARGEVGTSPLVETEPRLPLGEEPLPALPYGVQERLRDAWNATPVQEAPAELAAADQPPSELPPLGVAELPPAGAEARVQSDEIPASAVDTGDETGADGTNTIEGAESGTAPELVGSAPASDAEVATSLARQAGAEAARAFVAEMNVLLGQDAARIPPMDGEQPAEVVEEVAGESVADELSRQDVWQEEARAQRSAEDEQREMAMREQERAQAAAMTAWAVQQALTPFFTTLPQVIPTGAVPTGAVPTGAVPTGTAPPMQTTPTAGVGAPSLPGAATGVPGTTGGLVPSAGGLGLGAGGLAPTTGTVGGPVTPGALQPFPTGAMAPGATTLDGAGMGGMGAGAPLGGGLLVPPGGMMVPGTPLAPGGGLAPVGSPMSPLP